MALDNKLIKLRAAAKKAGIDNYGSMSRAELQAALDNAGDKPATSKRKRGGSRRKSAAAVAESKPTRKASGRKRKASVTKAESTEMTEKQAKRIVAKYAHKRGRRPAEYHEAMAILGDNSEPKPKPKAKGKSKRKSASVTKASSNGDAGRNLIDRKAIDWKADWNGGKSGNRAIIFKSLRKHAGNYAKVLKELLPNVGKMYAKSTKTGKRYNKAEQIAMLKWHIGRTAFDFVTDTGQHEKATNRKADKRTTKAGRKQAAKASDNGADVSDYSTAKLKRIVAKAAGRRGRKSAEVHAAMSELETREQGGAKAKPKSSGSKRQKGTQSRRKASRRKVKA